MSKKTTINNNMTETFVLSEPIIEDYDFEVTSDDNEGIIDIKSISDELESDWLNQLYFVTTYVLCIFIVKLFIFVFKINIFF